MADVWGALAQSAPTATTLTDVYTVPAEKVATVELAICNQAGSAGTFRVALAPEGAANTQAHYLYYDEAIGANTTVWTPRFTLAETDVVRVYVSSGNFSVTVNGIQEEQ